MDMSRCRALAGLALVAGSFVTGCEATPRVGDPVDNPPPPPGTFRAIVSDVFVQRCATSACHSGSTPQNSPSLDPERAFEQLVNVPAGQASSLDLVTPGEPENSYLVQRLHGDGAAQPMPPDGKLDDTTIETIEAWIRNGALDD